jgi:hypothetical protein
MDMKHKNMMTLGVLFLFWTSLLTIGCVAREKEPGYQFVATWGEKGNGPGEFHDPTGIAVTNREVFISDARNSRIQVFDFEGNFQPQFGTS